MMWTTFLAVFYCASECLLLLLPLGSQRSMGHQRRAIRPLHSVFLTLFLSNCPDITYQLRLTFSFPLCCFQPKSWAQPLPCGAYFRFCLVEFVNAMSFNVSNPSPSPSFYVSLECMWQVKKEQQNNRTGGWDPKYQSFETSLGPNCKLYLYKTWTVAKAHYSKYICPHISFLLINHGTYKSEL